MLTFHAKQCCGCCTVMMQFESLESIQKAFEKAGFDVAATIVDDAGEVHEEVDTFYGYAQTQKEAKDRSLGYLIGQIP